MRYATLQERKQFYTSEFNLEKVEQWFGKQQGKVKFAVIIGRHTRIYPEKYKQDASTTIIIDDYSSLEDVKWQIIEFLPEAVYYDRNVYDQKEGKVAQELAFDIDPENITCPIHGKLADKMKRGQGLSFCEIELEMAKHQTMGLHEYLEKQFAQLRIVYSGRGFHIHVFDKNAYGLITEERVQMAEVVKDKGFAIDAWVTTGEMRLIRLPHSLHGMVSHIVLPLEKNEVEKFNPVSDPRCIPAFMKM
jgi:DNA primase catalytic subunit